MRPAWQLLEQLLKDAKELTNQVFERYEKLVSDDLDKQKLNAEREDFNGVVQVVEQIISLSRANNNEEAAAILQGKGFPLQDNLAKKLNDHMEYNMLMASAGG